jgi:hypothetical protein
MSPYLRILLAAGVVGAGWCGAFAMDTWVARFAATWLTLVFVVAMWDGSS